MYIHLGQGTVVRSRDVIGIFDLESTTVSKHSRKFLNTAEKNGDVITVCRCKRGKQKKQDIYFSAFNLYPA